VRVVVDASPLIALDRIGCLHLLRDLYDLVVRPQSVLNELLAGQERCALSPQLIASSWILTEPDPPEMVLRKELGAGETAAVTLALKTQADLVVLDDLQARLVAAGLGLRVTGTLGILAAAHRRGLLADLAAALSALQQAGFHVTPELIARMKATEV
jgi:hypothetical protein